MKSRWKAPEVLSQVKGAWSHLDQSPSLCAPQDRTPGLQAKQNSNFWEKLGPCWMVALQSSRGFSSWLLSLLMQGSLINSPLSILVTWMLCSSVHTLAETTTIPFQKVSLSVPLFWFLQATQLSWLWPIGSLIPRKLPSYSNYCLQRIQVFWAFQLVSALNFF